MRYLLLIITVYLAAVIDTTVVDAVRVGHLTPDLLSMVALIWLLTASGPGAFLAAGVIGLLGDLVGPGPAGLGMAGMLLIGYAVMRLRARFLLENLPAQLAVIWIGGTVFTLLLATGHWTSGATCQPRFALLGRALGAGFYTAGVSLPVLMVVGWIGEPYRARHRRRAEF